MGKKEDLSVFEHGMLAPTVGARRVGLSISESADILGFLRTTLCKLGFTESSLKKRKYPVRGSCV